MSDIPELEKLYLPSHWSKRFSPEEMLPKFVEIISKTSEDVKETVPSQLDVPYGSSEKQKFDIYGTDLPEGSPIFVYIHGGYWQEPSIKKENSCYMAKVLHKNNCKVIVIGYTLCPHTSLPEIIKEIHLAIRKCTAYAQENGARTLVIGGHSVGAHLALSLFPNFYNSLTQDEQDLIKAVFLIGGIYDLTPLIRTTINDPLKLNFDSAHELSPLYQDFKSISTRGVKFLVLVGENDTPAFVKQAELFHNVLKLQGIESYLQILKDLDHFDVVEKLDREDYDVTQLIFASIL